MIGRRATREHAALAARLDPETSRPDIDLPEPDAGPAADPRARGWPLWRRWFAASTLGELAGFCLPAAVGPLVASGSAPVQVVALVAAGAVEGAMLGLGQAYALRPALPSVRPRSWVTATAAGAAIAWLIGMLPSTFGPRLWEFSPPLAVALAALGGVALLGSIGTLQWRVLRGHVSRPWRWIPATAAAWAAGLLAFTALTSPLWREGQPAALIAAIGVLGAVVMAATVAALTGLMVIRLVGTGKSGGRLR